MVLEVALIDVQEGREDEFAAAYGKAHSILATTPGGIAEMCITAKVLQLGVPLVTAAHVTRVIVLVTTTGSLFRVARLLARKPGKP